jgi:hypothetical protein
MLRIRDYILYPYKTSKITVLYILIFMSLIDDIKAYNCEVQGLAIILLYGY